MADIGAADSAVSAVPAVSGDSSTDCKASTTIPQDDNSPSSSGLPESSDQPTSYVIQSANSPSALTSTDQTTRNGATVLQPSKLGGNFRTGSFGSNPFAQNTVSHSEPVSDGVIAPSKFVSSPLTNRFSTGETDSDEGTKKREEINKFQFRPSILSSKVDTLSNKECTEASINSNVSSILRPATLPDPRQTSDGSGSDNEAQAKQVSSSSSSLKETQMSTSVISSTAPDEATKENHVTGLTEPRVPLSVGSSSYVFGENLSNRVTGVSSTNSNDDGASGISFGERLSERVKNGGSSGGVTEDDKEEEPENNDTVSSPDHGNQTLAESAREYQAKQENKLDLKEVEVVTGEEAESNVLQATAKLYLFDADNQSWIERGQGLCRLNDMTSTECGSFQSRLIMRTQGSLRVILNTPIWSGMTVERASPKSVRITATDGDDGVKVFVIMSNPKDSENVLRAIEWRIQRLKASDDTKPKPTDDRGSEKRKADSTEYESVGKKSRPVPESGVESTSGTSLLHEESDSSVQDPETEGPTHS